MAIAVDRGKFHWDDRVVDLDPDFALKDPWVTREFRMFDLLAQRSSLPPYANDMVGILGGDATTMMRSLRHVEPVSSFRSTFAYTNITHLWAGKIVAKAEGQPDWNAVLARDLLGPLGMKNSSYTAEAIEAAANHANGHRWTPTGTIGSRSRRSSRTVLAAPATSTPPSRTRPAGCACNSATAASRDAGSSRPRTSRSRGARAWAPPTAFYAMGWIVSLTPNGSVVWHNGGTYGFGAYVGMQLDRDVGIVILTNAQQVGFPDAVAAWAFDRLLDNPVVDHVANTLKSRDREVRGRGQAVRETGEPAAVSPARAARRQFRQPELRQGRTAVRW